MNLRLSLLLCCFVLLGASANAQNSLDSDIHNLQKQIQMWEVIVRENVKAPDNALNLRRLENKRRELLEAVTAKIGQLTAAGDTNSPRFRELTAIRNRLLNVVGPTQKPYQPQTAGVRAVTLDTIREGDIVVNGTSKASVSEVIVEVRSTGSTSTENSAANSRYSHPTDSRPRTVMQSYRVVRSSARTRNDDIWRFAVKLSVPLTTNDEVRAIPNGDLNAGSWMHPATRSGVGLSSIVNAAPAATLASENERQRRQRAIQEPTVPGSAGYPSGDPVPTYHRCSLPTKKAARDVYLDWNDGISPSRAFHSGTYCVHVLHVNPILYTYRITGTDLPQTSQSPLDLLVAAVTAVKSIPQPPPPAVNAQPEPCDALAPKIEDVKQEAADLEDALAVINPKQKDKTLHISRETTKNAFVAISAKFTDFERAVDRLRQTLANVPYAADCEAIKAANDLILDNYRASRQNFLNLQVRMNAPAEWATMMDVDSSAGKLIRVEELYIGERTEAAAKEYKLEPGYVVITSSAGFMITQLPARSYSAVTAPNPADPTTTQTVLSVDNGAGTRLALTALLNYNLPFAVQKDFGVALSVGPVFDISAGKADTSRFGLFGGVGLRLKQLMYITPGVHIGEFADFPQGFTRTGQVVPANFPTPTPVKRWSTRFALGITFKVKDLWTPSGSSEAPVKGSN